MKIVKKIIVSILCIFIFLFAVTELAIIYKGNESPKINADYIIILGAQIWGDKPSPELKNRIDASIEYYKNNPNVKFIATGGYGENEIYSEGEIIKNYLLSNNIPEENIFVEDKSKNTRENILFSKQLLEKEGISMSSSKFLIASNKYHILRAEILAKNRGLDADGLPAKVEGSIKVRMYIREVFAVWKDLFLEIFN